MSVATVLVFVSANFAGQRVVALSPQRQEDKQTV